MSGKIMPVKTGPYRAWWEKDSVDDDKAIEYDGNEKNELIIKNNMPAKVNIKQHTALNETKPIKNQSYQADVINNLGNLAADIVAEECLYKELKSNRNFVQKSPKDFKYQETLIKNQSKPRGFKENYPVKENISEPKYPNNYSSFSSSFVQKRDQYAIHQNHDGNDCEDSKKLIPFTNESNVHQCKKQSVKYRTQISGDRYKEILKILYGVERNLESIGNETLDVHCKSRKSVVRISSIFTEKSFTSISTGKKSRSKKKGVKSNHASKTVSNYSNTSRKRVLKYKQQHLSKNHQCHNDIIGFKFPQQNAFHSAASCSNNARLGVSCSKVINNIQCPICVLHTSNAPSSSSDKEYEDSSSSIPLFEDTTVDPVTENENSAIMYRSKYLQKFISHSKHLNLQSESCDKTLKKIINCPQLGLLNEEKNTEYSNSGHHETNMYLNDVGTNTSPSLEYKTESHLGQISASTRTLPPNKSIISCNGFRFETSQGTSQPQYFGNITKLKDSNSTNTTEYLSSFPEPERVFPTDPSSSGNDARKTCLTIEKCEPETKTKTFNQIESNSSSSRTSGTYNLEKRNSNKSNRSLKIDDSTDSNASNSSCIPKGGKSCIEAYIPSDISENNRFDQAKGKHWDNECKTSGRKTLFDTVEITEKDSTGIVAKDKLASFNSGSEMSKMLYDASSVTKIINKDVAVGDRTLQREQKQKLGKPLVHQIEHSTYDFKDVAKEKLVNFNLGNEMTDTLYGTTYLKENNCQRNSRIQRSKSKYPLEINSTCITETEVKSKENIDNPISKTVCEEMVTVKPSFKTNEKNYEDKYFLTHDSNAVVAKNQNIPHEQTLHHTSISAVGHSKEETISPEFYLCTSSTPLTSDMNYVNNISNSFQMGNNIFQNQIPYVCYPVSIGIIGPSGLHPNLYNNMNFAQFLSKNTVIPQASPVAIKESLDVENSNPHNTELKNKSFAENILSSENRKDISSDNNKAGTRDTNSVENSGSNTSKLDKRCTLQTTEATLECESSKIISRPSCPAQLAKRIAHESLSGQNVASILYGGYEETKRPDKSNAKYISLNRETYKWSKSEYISEVKQENVPDSIHNRLEASGPSSFQASKDKIAERNISCRKPKGIVPGLEDITD